MKNISIKKAHNSVKVEHTESDHHARNFFTNNTENIIEKRNKVFSVHGTNMYIF